MKSSHRILCFSILAGAITGTLGAGGGLILAPALSFFSIVEEPKVFPTSLAVMLPVCIASLVFSIFSVSVPWFQVFPYIWGSLLGGAAAIRLGRKIPVSFLHRILGILILWGGIRFLL